MEPAKKREYWETQGAQHDPTPEPEREIPEWENKLGKVIFYLTVAASLWFFYWLNGVQCPC